MIHRWAASNSKRVGRSSQAVVGLRAAVDLPQLALAAVGLRAAVGIGRCWRTADGLRAAVGLPQLATNSNSTWPKSKPMFLTP